jgi:hypothetical protein
VKSSILTAANIKLQYNVVDQARSKALLSGNKKAATWLPFSVLMLYQHQLVVYFCCSRAMAR